MNPTGRFAGRAALYAKYRPGYPPEVIDVLRRETGLNSTSVVADIGSGTGISTRLLAPHVARVYAAEPNAEMREQALADGGDFVSVNATAEATTLPDASIDHVVAATAFHWFDQAKCRREFRRILKPNGWVVLMWNMRKTESSPLVEQYEKLLEEFGTDYQPTLMSQNWNAPAEQFYGAGNYGNTRLDYCQFFDFEGFKGRLLSASYAPLEGHPNHEPMLVRLREIFDRNQIDGQVRFDYDTHIYWGRICM